MILPEMGTLLFPSPLMGEGRGEGENKERLIFCFYQEIYNSEGELVEIHRKYPVDTGHEKIDRKRENRL